MLGEIGAPDLSKYLLHTCCETRIGANMLFFTLRRSLCTSIICGRRHQASPAACHARRPPSCMIGVTTLPTYAAASTAQLAINPDTTSYLSGSSSAVVEIIVRLHHGGLPRLGRYHHTAPHRDAPAGGSDLDSAPKRQRHGHRRRRSLPPITAGR